MRNDDEAHAFAFCTWKWAINNVQAKNWTKKHFRLKLIYGSESSVQGKKICHVRDIERQVEILTAYVDVI